MRWSWPVQTGMCAFRFRDVGLSVSAPAGRFSGRPSGPVCWAGGGRAPLFLVDSHVVRGWQRGEAGPERGTGALGRAVAVGRRLAVLGWGRDRRRHPGRLAVRRSAPALRPPARLAPTTPPRQFTITTTTLLLLSFVPAHSPLRLWYPPPRVLPQPLHRLIRQPFQEGPGGGGRGGELEGGGCGGGDGGGGECITLGCPTRPACRPGGPPAPPPVPAPPC